MGALAHPWVSVLKTGAQCSYGKLGSEIFEEGWTLADEDVVVLGCLLLLSKNVTFDVTL